MIVDDIIYYKGRIYLVMESMPKNKSMQASHNSPLAGHPGFLKTYRNILERFSSKGLKEDVLNHVKECNTFHYKKEHTHQAILLQPLPIPKQKSKSISMYFIKGLSEVQGRDYIYVVVDQLTKFTHFFSNPLEYAIAQVPKLFLREVFRLHILPKSIVSDMDSRFLSSFWKELFRLVGTKLT